MMTTVPEHSFFLAYLNWVLKSLTDKISGKERDRYCPTQRVTMHPVVSNKIFLIKSDPEGKQPHMGLTLEVTDSGLF